MTTVTGLTADRMLTIEAASVVDGDVDSNGNLILTKHDGSQINAGSVIGPVGPAGPVGQDKSVLSAAGILDVGLANQIRAGRQLSPADFAAIGLNAPAGLWNLSDLSDASGNGRALNNKGAVPFASGINGAANTAAQFSGNTGQALYIPDTGAADPFRIKTGSIGCWFRLAKLATSQVLFTKLSSGSGQYSWEITLNNTNQVAGYVSPDGVGILVINGTTNISDDKWHFVVLTTDGIMMRLYVDGILEAIGPSSILFGSSAPLNIGARGGDASTTSSLPFFGRVDEAFITADVLSDDQVRNLYCVKIPHTLAAVPSRISLNVRRRKKGAAFVPSDFPTPPLRLHNFSAGSLGDQGSNNVALVNNGGALSVVGADGGASNAFNFNGSQSLSSTDAGLPTGIAARSYGCWIRYVFHNAFQGIITWGTVGTGETRIDLQNDSIRFISNGDVVNGPVASDGMWHFVVGVEDNTAVDGVKRKLYLDGRFVVGSTVLNPITLVGANHFRLGSNTDGSGPYIGQIDGAFVCDYILTPANIAALYAKGSQALSPSPKNVGDHVEAMDAANLYATFDSLDSQHQIDLAVA